MRTSSCASTARCASASAARASTRSARRWSYAASPRTWSATTTTSASPVPWRRSPTTARWSASWSPRISGFGPLQPFLDDPEVEEVWINSPERVFIARRGRHELTNLRLDAAQVNELVERMLKSSGRRIDISTPFVDAMLPEGHRLHVVLEGITRGFTAVNIRKFLLRAHRLSDLVGARQPDTAGGVASSRRPCAPASTSSSPAGRRPARRRCSTAWPPRCPAASAWSAPRRSSSCGSATPTGSRCRPGRPGSSRPARSSCATWSRRRCGCGRAASWSARSARPSASTCCSRSTPGCPGCARSTPTAPARRS